MSHGDMRPLEHTSDSANIAYYRERGAKPSDPYVWVEVLRSGIEKVDGEWRSKARPDFYVTVRRINGTASYTNPLTAFTYTPKSRPTHGALPARTVTRIVREAIAALDEDVSR
jgi:hypothetical protein